MPGRQLEKQTPNLPLLLPLDVCPHRAWAPVTQPLAGQSWGWGGGGQWSGGEMEGARPWKDKNSLDIFLNLVLQR